MNFGGRLTNSISAGRALNATKMTVTPIITPGLTLTQVTIKVLQGVLVGVTVLSNCKWVHGLRLLEHVFSSFSLCFRNAWP